ncbi:Retrovirus-related Pol polyprotein from transposon 17.6, partial [Mucuna pruriens]
MKYPVGQEVGRIWANHQVTRQCYEDNLRISLQPFRVGNPNVNVLDLDLDPRCEDERKRPLLAKDLKKVSIGPKLTHKTKIGTTLAHEDESHLVSFLRENWDVFAWSLTDMPKIDPNFLCHRLSISPNYRSVSQRRKKEIQYPSWLANVVMVKKANGKWYMCTDYTDLNKAYPKDPYSLPNIDRLVDEASNFALLNFMDTYSGYNQIKMDPQDEAKTAFITDSGTYCYKVIPFGLKNAGATYQCLMDKIFKEIIGIDVEVYVDDMVVKTTVAANHYRALGRVFQVLRKHRLKLNPEKCSFRVRVGKFLEFMLTERGIEANPEKCQAVINMRSPITTLSRFLSRSVETIVPIFNTLRKGDTFTWTVETEEKFLRLKALLASPLILTKSTLGIPLLAYISVVEDVVSATIVQEKEGEQQPVYFISKVLQDVERRYQKIEKAAFTLIIASRIPHNRSNRPIDQASAEKTRLGR